jgi:putative phage-type endonuclease
MQQNSAEWLEARRRYIGSSDTPIILGISPFKTALQLYEEKVGLRDPPKGNFATARGHAMENVVRQKCEFKTGKRFEPKVFTEGFLIASLDGFDGDTVLEIKNPGAEAHAIAKAGKVPAYYYAQMQHQMHVAGVFKGIYASYNGDDLVMLDVTYSLPFFAYAFEKLEFFKHCVDTKTPPEPSSDDYVTVNDPALEALAANYVALARQARDLEEQKKLLAKVIDSGLKHPKTRVGAFKVQRVSRKGNVDYKKVPELKGVDLEPYRGEAVTFVQVTK